MQRLQMDRKSISKSFIKSVSAHSWQPSYAGELNYEQIRDTVKHYLPLQIDVPVDVIYREIVQCSHLLVEHRGGYESQGWKSFCIHGRSLTETREQEYYDTPAPMEYTKETQELMPETVDWLRNTWPHGDYARVRVMCLEPGGWIGVHTDNNLNCLGPVNIAITQPNECNFYMEHAGVIPFQPGSAMWLNVSNKHAVINNSDQPRYHIIIHQTESADWHRLVLKSYNSLDKQS